MGILSGLLGLLGLLGCNTENQKNNATTQSDKRTIKIEQKEGFTEVETGNYGVKTLNIEQDSLYFLPIIRNFEDDDTYCQTVIHEKLGNNIGAFIAKVEVRPNGRTGIDYVLKSNLAQYKMSEKAILSIAAHNLKNAKLKIEGMNDSKTGDKMISVSSKIGLATCILYDYDFIDKLKTDLKTNELHVTIINSGTVYFTTPNNSFEDSFEKIAVENTYTDVVNINSSMYLWTNHTLKLLRKYRN